MSLLDHFQSSASQSFRYTSYQTLLSESLDTVFFFLLINPKQVCLQDGVHHNLSLLSLVLEVCVTCLCAGHLLGGGPGQVPVQPHVRMVGEACQQDSGHQEQTPVLHRRTGYRRFRDLRREC